jgi:hypothetical protein
MVPIEATWGDSDHTVLKVELWDWGWDDIASGEVVEARRAIFEASPRPVTMLFVMRDAPRNLLGMLPHVAQSPGFSHPNMKQVVIVADKSIIRVASDIFQRVFGQASRRMRVVSSLDKANRVIAERPQDNDQPRAAGQ